MKVLVIGGMHGNEPLGLALAASLKRQPIPNVSACIANTQAVRKTKRFTTTDLNRSFPGSLQSSQYEYRRAAELLELCRQYDVVLDFHNTHCPDNDCVFVGDAAQPLLYKLASWIGLKRVVVADYDCINKYAPNCASIEISLQSTLMDVTGWRKILRDLTMLDTLPKVQDLELYKFVYRMTLADRDRLTLDKYGFQAFQPIPPEVATKLRVQNPAYPIFIADAYTPYNYGGLLNKTNV